MLCISHQREADPFKVWAHQACEPPAPSHTPLKAPSYTDISLLFPERQSKNLHLISTILGQNLLENIPRHECRTQRLMLLPHITRDCGPDFSCTEGQGLVLLPSQSCSIRFLSLQICSYPHPCAFPFSLVLLFFSTVNPFFPICHYSSKYRDIKSNETTVSGVYPREGQTTLTGG